ncbi:MAG: hypothetical protein CM15mP18_4280 [Methanobacteriota archaeon]|nr:MAG: hypothetical protein CM15mP18_4280 [Euryarchaeota archaeon]
MWGLDGGEKRALKQGSVVLGVIALLVIAPALPAAMNLMPTPPPTPAQGYGAVPGPFLTETTPLSYDRPSTLWMCWSWGQRWCPLMTVTWPVYRSNRPACACPSDCVPWIGAPLASDYTDWTEHLAAKGMVVVHVAYPSHLILKGGGAHRVRRTLESPPTCPQDGRQGRRHGRPEGELPSTRR